MREKCKMEDLLEWTCRSSEAQTSWVLSASMRLLVQEGLIRILSCLGTCRLLEMHADVFHAVHG